MADHTLTLLFISALVCIISALSPGRTSPMVRVRHKRDADDDTIAAALVTYTRQLRKIESRIAYQQETMRRQKQRILFLKRFLRDKGDKHELDDLKNEIETDMGKIKEEAKLPALDHLNKRLDARDEALQVLKKRIDKDAAVIPVIKQRVLDNKAICRVVTTDWKSGASAMIGELSEHKVECKKDEFINKFVLDRESPTLESRVRYRYSCCRFSLKDGWKSAGS